jgi:hypothetical protein
MGRLVILSFLAVKPYTVRCHRHQDGTARDIDRMWNGMAISRQRNEMLLQQTYNRACNESQASQCSVVGIPKPFAHVAKVHSKRQHPPNAVAHETNDLNIKTRW